MALHPGDDVLVRETLAGESAAFEVLVRRYRRPAIACAIAVVGDTADAEDVVQESMVKAYEQLATLRTPAKFGGWLLTMVRRQALNTLRSTRRRRLVPLTPDVPSTHDPVGARLAAGDARSALSVALATLSPVQCEVVLLSDLADWSHAQIAMTLGISEDMSRRHLSDGRRRLRERLQIIRPEL